MEDLLKAMEANQITEPKTNNQSLKVESLDSSIMYLKTTKESIAVWKMLGLFTMKVKLPRKLKKKTNLIERDSVKEAYRVKLIARAGFTEQYIQYKVTQSLIKNRFNSGGYQIIKK